MLCSHHNTFFGNSLKPAAVPAAFNNGHPAYSPMPTYQHPPAPQKQIKDPSTIQQIQQRQYLEEQETRHHYMD